MSDPPTITVAVPTCNGARHLRAALESVLAQSISFDLLIVDDRSDDDTLAIAQSVVGDRARVEVNPERLGLARNWNRCVALSQTPVVAIFHQDDEMRAGHLETHLAAYRANPNLGWVASQVKVIDQADQPILASVVDPGGLGELDRDFAVGVGVNELATHNPLRCSAVTINRAAHAQVGGFDPSYRYVVDWDYWVRVAQVRPVAWRARTTAAIRWHLASETHRFVTGTADLEETSRLLDRIEAWRDPAVRMASGWRDRADRRLARAFLNRAYVASRQGNGWLARQALLRSLRLAPAAMLRSLATDPRLLARLGGAWLPLASSRSWGGGSRLPNSVE